MILVVGGFGLFIMEGYPHLPNKYMAGYHRIIGYFIMSGCLVNFAVCSLVSPGVVKADTVVRYSVFPYDRVLYHAKECPTCKILKCVLCECSHAHR